MAKASEGHVGESPVVGSRDAVRQSVTQ